MRGKAIAAVKRGERKTDVSKMFGISRNTLDYGSSAKLRLETAAPSRAISKVHF